MNRTILIPIILLLVFTSCEKDFPLVNAEGGFTSNHIPYTPEEKTKVIAIDVHNDAFFYFEYIYKNPTTGKTEVINETKHLSICYDYDYLETHYENNSTTPSNLKLWRDSEKRIRAKKDRDIKNVTIKTNSYNESYGIRITIKTIGSQLTEDIFYNNFEFIPTYNNYYFGFGSTIYRKFNNTELSYQNQQVFSDLYLNSLSYSNHTNSLIYCESKANSSVIKMFKIDTKQTNRILFLDYYLKTIKAVNNSSDIIVNDVTNHKILFYNEVGIYISSITSNYEIIDASSIKIDNYYQTVYIEKVSRYSFKINLKNDKGTSTLATYRFATDIEISNDGKVIALINNKDVYIKNGSKDFQKIIDDDVTKIDFNDKNELIVIKDGGLYKLPYNATELSLLQKETHSIKRVTW